MSLRMFVIYESPQDAPGRYVVRGWTSGGLGSLQLVPDEEPLAVVATLAEARARVPVGLVRLVRDPEDPPTIVETWL